MRLPGALSLSLLALTLTSALPVHSLLQLTPDNFDKTVAQGYWYIEHFSPWCHHCKEFLPTWEKLVEKAGTTDNLKHIKLAQVDCAEYGDLCNSHNVKGYPQMNLYHDGKFVKTFKGGREMDRLVTFLETNAPAPEPEVKKVEAPLLNTDGALLSLTPSNYQATVDKGPVFVKFYAPWCGHCKKLAPTWVQLARHMQNKMNVAEVNCEEHSSLCSKEKIEGYPTLIYFNNGVRKEYNGGRKIDQLKEFATKASAPPVQQIEASSLDKHLAENPVAFLLIQSSATDPIFQTVKTASSSLLGSAPVFAITSSDLLVKYGFPSATAYAIIAFQSGTVSASTTTPSNLSNWFSAHALPAALELSQDSFQSVMNAPHRPLVVIAAVTPATKDRVSAKVVELGKKWVLKHKGTQRASEVVFTWMDSDRWEKWMKSMYGLSQPQSDAVDPPIVIADHQGLIYYDQDASGGRIQMSSTRLFETVEAALTKQLSPKHSENLVERFARATSARLIAAETYVVEHPLHALMFVMGAAGGLFWVLKRWLSAEELDAEMAAKKASRLD